MALLMFTNNSFVEGSSLYTWLEASTGDTFTTIQPTNGAALGGCLQVVGTWGGATVALQGSNTGAPGEWFPILDLDGNAISLTANGSVEFSSAARFFRPVISGGTGDNVVVSLNMVG